MSDLGLFAPTPLVEAYFNKVSAPKKRLIIIEDAHNIVRTTAMPSVNRIASGQSSP